MQLAVLHTVSHKHGHNVECGSRLRVCSIHREEKSCSVWISPITTS